MRVLSTLPAYEYKVLYAFFIARFTHKKRVAVLKVEAAGIGEGISEVIVTTESGAGVPNAAPIGIISERTTEGERSYFVKFYRGSQTLANVLETGRLAANVTSDAALFVQTAFDDLPVSCFTVFAGMPVLREANAWIIFTCELVDERQEYLRFQLCSAAVKINRKEVKAINRGLNAVIEATVLATRLRITTEKRERQVLKQELEQYAAIVATCGGLRENQALAILREKFFKGTGKKQGL